jgi:hypothetical protein
MLHKKNRRLTQLRKLHQFQRHVAFEAWDPETALEGRGGLGFPRKVGTIQLNLKYACIPIIRSTLDCETSRSGRETCQSHCETCRTDCETCVAKLGIRIVKLGIRIVKL